MVQDGQMTIFDFLPQQESQQVDKKQQEVAICSQKDNCDAFGFGCGGTVEPCIFGGAFHWDDNLFKYQEHTEPKTKPLWDSPECSKDHTKLCNRWGDKLEDYKSDLPKGFACAGCCWYCSEAPQHGGKCKFECRRDK